VEEWADLCRRIKEILGGQSTLLILPGELEKVAQRYAAQLIVRSKVGLSEQSGPSEARFAEVDIET
jgi:hypothetical protein